MSAPATIGHNNPPEPSPFELVQNGINDLYEEARQWLDGEPVTTQKQADSLQILDDQLKKIAKEAETMRVAERQPHLDANKAIQARFLPLLEKTDKARECISEAQKPFMIAKQKQQEEEARKIREEADKKHAGAVAALQSSSLDNLAEREAAEAKLKEAKNAAKDAKRAEKARPNVKGEGRAKTLSTTYTAVINDMRLAIMAMYERYPQPYHELTQRLCDQSVSPNGKQIPGVEVKEHMDVRG